MPWFEIRSTWLFMDHPQQKDCKIWCKAMFFFMDQAMKMMTVMKKSRLGLKKIDLRSPCRNSHVEPQFPWLGAMKGFEPV